MNITKAQADKVIAALEKAGAAKLADGTYLDKDCSITMALSIMRGLAEDAEPETAMVDAAMVAMKGIYPPLRRSECQQLIRAAFNATSPQAAQTDEREAFEAWALRTICHQCDLQQRHLTGYASQELNYLWRGWQAGRAGRKG